MKIYSVNTHVNRPHVKTNVVSKIPKFHKMGKTDFS